MKKSVETLWLSGGSDAFGVFFAVGFFLLLILFKYLWPIFKALCFLRCCHVCHMPKAWFPACCYFLPTVKSFNLTICLLHRYVVKRRQDRLRVWGYALFLNSRLGKKPVSLLVLTFWTENIL